MHLLSTMITLSLLLGISVGQPARALPADQEFCGELKSVEMSHGPYTWAFAQVFNESRYENPMVLVGDEEAVKAILGKLPAGEIRADLESSSKVWNPPLGGESVYWICFQGSSPGRMYWGKKSVPLYGEIYSLTLLHRGKTILLYFPGSDVEIVSAHATSARP
jgi:hypothetical protein